MIFNTHYKISSLFKTFKKNTSLIHRFKVSNLYQKGEIKKKSENSQSIHTLILKNRKFNDF